MKQTLAYSPARHMWGVLKEGSQTCLDYELFYQPNKTYVVEDVTFAMRQYHPGKNCPNRLKVGIVDGEVIGELLTTPSEGQQRLWFNGLEWRSKTGVITRASKVVLSGDGRVYLVE